MAIAEGPQNNPLEIRGLKAGEALTGKQFYGVKFNADRQVILMAAVTDVCCGILQNAPASGETAEVATIGTIKIIAGETISAGDKIRIHSDGKAMIFAPDTDTTATGYGVCHKGGAANEYIEAFCVFGAGDRGEE